MTGTVLVNNKTVTSYKSAQGQRYLTRKDYYQNVQRMQRQQNQSNIMFIKSTTPQKATAILSKTSKTKHSPFVQAVNDLQDTSDDDDESVIETDAFSLVDQSDKSPTLLEDTPEVDSSKLKSNEDDDESISSIQKHASDLENNMDRAFDDLKTQEENPTNNEKITKVIHDAINIKKQPIVNRLGIREDSLKRQNAMNNNLLKELQNLIDSTIDIQANMLEQRDKITDKISFLQCKMAECEKTISDVIQIKDDLMTTVLHNVKSKLDEVTSTSTGFNNKHIQDMESKFKCRLKRLKESTIN